MKSYMLMTGFLGGAIASLFGGFNGALMTLLIFMGIDYISGLMVAGVFHKSKKTEHGALSSHIGFKGLCKKGMILLMVLIAYRFDIVLNTDFVRNAVIIGYIANESISIIENAGLMGLPVPSVITKAIDVLKQKAERGNDVK